ncbi:MAG: type II toxin-antitoxin system RelE/ParE family toxin [Gemmatimonadaceae bacterium]|nr:type II toxin-antitoxin system RelE/ParE family toxin [Gemmatimonadaceae bacterium]
MTAVRWTETAARDLETIRDYIAQDSPTIARMVVSRLVEATAVLRHHPDAGRIVPERGESSLRELIRAPYRIVYERRADIVVVLTVFHSARLFPADIP